MYLEDLEQQKVIEAVLRTWQEAPSTHTPPNAHSSPRTSVLSLSPGPHSWSKGAGDPDDRVSLQSPHTEGTQGYELFHMSWFSKCHHH